MKSHTLNFILPFNHRMFEIEFESESRERNLLMEVKMEGYPLDTVEIRQTHPLLYADIKSAMANNADTYWSEVEEGAIKHGLDEILSDANNILKSLTE